MNRTYDPIEETAELRRVRVWTPLRPPALGTALVLEPAVGTALVIEPGGAVPEPRTGNYRRKHVVNTKAQSLSFATRVPSKDSAFPFDVTVSFACQVLDPLAIVRDGVHDMTAALIPSLVGIIRPVAREYDVLDPAPVEAEIAIRLNGARSPSAVRLSEFTVQVGSADTTDIVTAKQKLRVQGMYRDGMRPVATGGREEMLAHVMGMTGGDPMPLLDREQDAKDRQAQTSLDALRALMDSSKPLSQHRSTKIGEQAVESLFPGSLNGARSGGIRDRIERKTHGALDGKPVVEGSSEAKSSEPADAKPKSSDNGTKQSGNK